MPNGIGQVKPNHYGDMLKVLWRNRDELPFAWRILRDGACDGCALGTSGLRDWTLDGVHLCMVRLNLLRLNTMPALDPARLARRRERCRRTTTARCASSAACPTRCCAATATPASGASAGTKRSISPPRRSARATRSASRST